MGDERIRLAAEKAAMIVESSLLSVQVNLAHSTRTVSYTHLTLPTKLEV